MYNDRGMIKWLPFNSVISEDIIFQNINQKKQIVSLPILSEEQQNYLENKLKEALFTQEKIKIKYFYHNKIWQKEGIITKIIAYQKRIIINDSFSIHFCQIIDIF